MELNSFGVVELAAIVGTCLVALATFIFIKDKSVNDEFKAIRNELMTLNNACVKREELHTMLTTIRSDVSEIRATLFTWFDKQANKA